MEKVRLILEFVKALAWSIIALVLESCCSLLKHAETHSYEFDYMGLLRPWTMGFYVFKYARDARKLILVAPMTWAQGVGRSNRPAPTNENKCFICNGRARRG